MEYPIKPKRTDTKAHLLKYIEDLNTELERTVKIGIDNMNTNSKLRVEMSAENGNLKTEVRKLKDEIQILKNELEEIKNKPIQKIKNERNAGRKTMITPYLINNILAMSKAGNTQKDIAQRLGVSVGLVNKVLQANRE